MDGAVNGPVSNTANTINTTTNGASTPNTIPSENVAATLGIKRKRSESDQQDSSLPSSLSFAQDHPPSHVAGTSPLEHPISPVYLDYLAVLKQYDTTPSVLEHTIPESLRQDAPTVKRVKLTEGHAAASTLTSRIQTGFYTSLQELHRDILHICASIVDSIKDRDRLKNGSRIPPDDIKFMQRVLAFQHEATTLLTREGKMDSKPDPNAVTNGPVSDPNASSEQPGKTVLTLFGNAPTPKQLFSSFQHPPHLSSSSHPSPLKADGVDISLEELGLPNMLNATKVMPLDPDTALGSRPREPTFAEVFPPPSTLPQLTRPKPKSNTRSASLHWLPVDSLLPKPSRKNVYTMQPLNVGSWIDYGGRNADKESSGSIKRRRRESIVTAPHQTKSVQEMSPAELVAQEEALFKAAYSSFAPSVDNAKAIVPDDVRARVWWHKVGQKRFDKHFVLDPALDTAFPSTPDDHDSVVVDEDATLYGVDELKDFQQVVDNFDEDAFKAENLISTINDCERTVDEMLQEISTLLETLASYQRIRNSYLVPVDPLRNPTSPGALLAATLGTPTEPTKEEIATYKALRSQLAQTIAKLPPYAVAKLDGEQLEDLAVNKTMIIKGKEFKGTMEEDQLTRVIRSTAAMQTTAAPATAPRPSTEFKNTSSSYGRTPSMVQQPRSAHAPGPAYYGGGARTPATNFNRSTVAQSYKTPAATAPRPSYGQAGGFPNTVPRQPSYGQNHAQSNGHAQSYRPNYSHNGNYNNQQTPQPPAQTSVQTPAMYTAQQNQYRNAVAYGQNVALPGTPSYNPQQGTQARQSYGAGAAATQYMQQRPNGQTPQPQQPQQQQFNGQQQQSHQAPPSSGRATPTFGINGQTPSSLGPSGFHTSMTSEQQQIMLERQRAQLAQQPAARMQAQADMQRMTSLTPQPAQQQQQQQQPNGDASRGGGASSNNGTPMVA